LDKQLKRLGKVQNYETTTIARNGQKISVNLTQTQMEDKTGDAPVSLIILRDITARRERESVLFEKKSSGGYWPVNWTFLLFKAPSHWPNPLENKLNLFKSR
jgi:hypothetical protein